MNHEQILFKNLKLVLNDENAIQMCLHLFKISQIWDDLHDGDSVDNNGLSDVFKMILVDLPDNPFYDKFRFQLRPLILSTILQWETANLMEAAKESPDKSYMLRAGIYGIFHMCVYFAHGSEVAKKAGPIIYSFYGETVNNFLKNKEGEKNA